MTEGPRLSRPPRAATASGRRASATVNLNLYLPGRGRHRNFTPRRSVSYRKA
jgi:hypothetical protein